MGKNKLITVKTPFGDRRILYTQNGDSTEKNVLVCRECSYNKVCKFIRDPRDPENKEKTFIDFCSSIQEDDMENLPPEEDSISTYFPERGAIEDALGKDFPDILKTVIDENPRVYVEDVIEEVCKGWCDDYTPERTNCNCNNMSCILRSLFLKTKSNTNE